MDEFLSRLFTRMSDEEWIDPDRVVENVKVLYDALTHINHNTCPADEKAFTKWFACIMMWCIPYSECEMIADDLLRHIRGEEDA